ncbi:MAG: patatin-like phospholipase family protein [Bacteroidales bacterium]|nr:patatin-like phospholipase family protein [Bacteroidales bacterium]
MRKYKLGIVLSGGGARGIAHLGVLDALHKHGIEPEVVSGSSIGAIVGCFYAAGVEPSFILDEIKKEKLTRFFSWSFPLSGFLDLDYMQEWFAKHISEDNFRALKKPFFISVTNLNSGKNEIINEGPLFDFVIASSTIPLIFKPRIINNNTYVDGGILNNMPAIAIRDFCDTIIGVNINHSGPLEKIHGMKEIVERSLRLAIESNIKENMRVCDIMIQPEEMKGISTFEFRRADEIYQIGFDATEEMMPEIRNKLGQSHSEISI